eukprot:5443254-Pyramimonas_sp.AAC.1
MRQGGPRKFTRVPGDTRALEKEPPPVGAAAGQAWPPFYPKRGSLATPAPLRSTRPLDGSSAVAGDSPA